MARVWGILKRWGVPVSLTLAAIAYLVHFVDIADTVSRMTPRTLAILGTALLLFGFFSTTIEAMTLRRLLHSSRPDFTFMTAVRIKSSSYLLAVVHYTLGAATLSVLLGRRSGVSIERAAGIILLVMMVDLGMVLSMIALGATLGSSVAVPVQLGLVIAIVVGVAGGLALLRAPFSLGPIDVLRDRELFSAARGVSSRDLAELIVVRFVFVLGFESLGWAALTAFGVSVPPAVVLVNFSGVMITSMLPAVAGIGPTQIAMVEFFRAYGSPEALLACSVALSAGLITMRTLLGIVFVGELRREDSEAPKLRGGDEETAD